VAQALLPVLHRLRAGATRDPVIYPYSVIPGGVRSAGELRRAIRSDPIVQRAYAGFAVDRCRLVTLRHDRWEYVSYCYGDEIFWTGHKVRIRKGEQVITDGKHEARARCGNWISEIPRAPVWAAEPPIRVLETPASGSGDRDSGLGFALTHRFAVPPLPQAGEGQGVEEAGEGEIIESAELPAEGVGLPWGVLPILPLAGSGGGAPAGVPVPPTPVPESGTLAFLVIGLAMAWLKLRPWRGRGACQ
jgi:hypothetical protein